MLGIKKHKNHVNQIFCILLAVTFITLAFVYINGEKNKKIWSQEFANFQKARNLINSRLPDEAEQLILPLIRQEKYQKSPSINWVYGILLASQERYDEAEKYMLKAKDLRPLVLLDYGFTVQLGEIYYKIDNYPEARKYLLLGQEINKDGQFTEYVNNMLKDISIKQKM